MIYWILFFIGMGVLGRLSGIGFGKKWGVSWLPELLHSLPYGVVAGGATDALGFSFLTSLCVAAIGSMISYGGMQSATWLFLKWESHDDPDLERTSTLKPIIDWLAKFKGWKLGDEGYSWIASGVKGLIVSLPVGGLFGAIFFALGDEVGSHAKGRVEKFGLDPHAFREFLRSGFGAVSIYVFTELIKIAN